MLTNHSTRGIRRFVVLAGLAAAGLLASHGAEAHFHLNSPANWAVQDTQGNPQKMGPCGNEGTPMMSNMMTPFHPGDTVTINLNETVFHPGHYRIALANTQNMLPAEPTVTPTAQDQCASAAIQTNPTMPILADGVLKHTTAFNGAQTIQVKIPANFTCTNCVLQVLEFMSSHPAPCFYHHCANISVQGTPGDGGPTVDAGKDASMGTGGASGTTTTGGGSTTTSGSGGASTTGAGGDGTGTTGSGTTTTGVTTTTGGPQTGTTASTTSAGTGTTSTTGDATGAGGSGAGGGSTDSGCSCSLVSTSSSSLYGISTLAALAFAIGRRRRRRPE